MNVRLNSHFRVIMFTPALVMGILVTILNLIKLFMIKRKWKTIKPYEILLLILSASDTSLGIVILTYTACQMLEINSNTVAVIHDASFGISMVTSFVAMLLICVDRLIAVRFPLRHRAMVTRGNALKAGASLWLITILGLFIPALLSKLNVISIQNDMAFIGACGLLAFQIFTFVMYGIVIWVIVKNRNKMTRIDTGQRENRSFSEVEKVAFVTCAFTVSAFIICTMPSTVELLLKKTDVGNTLSWTDYLCMSNAIANPLIYFMKFFITKKRLLR